MNSYLLSFIIIDLSLSLVVASYIGYLLYTRYRNSEEDIPTSTTPHLKIIK